MICSGTWRSPVAHVHGVHGVVGSNPAVPTFDINSSYLGLDDGNELSGIPLDSSRQDRNCVRDSSSHCGDRSMGLPPPDG